MVYYLMNKMKSLSLPEQTMEIFVSDALRTGHSTHDGGVIDEAAVWHSAFNLDEIKMAMKGDMLAVFPKDVLAITWSPTKIR